MTDTLAIRITGGVDTHKDVHVAAALDQMGRSLGTASFPVTAAGYQELHRWLATFGPVDTVGVEGTSSYGAALTRYLADSLVPVVEVNRPNRQVRRNFGKSDTLDAVSAARSVQAGTALGIPKSVDGVDEAIRLLRVARRGAVKGRTQAATLIRDVVSTSRRPFGPSSQGSPRRSLPLGRPGCGQVPL